MSVLIDVSEGVEPLLSDDEVEDICAYVLVSEGVSQPSEISLSWVRDAEIRELNKTWRGIDQVTDVLSFPLDGVDDEESRSPDEPLELGDVVLAPGRIAEQAPGFGNTPADECRLMLVHALLHLLGYDHVVDDEAEVMEAREDELLRKLAERRGASGDTVAVGPTTRHEHD